MNLCVYIDMDVPCIYTYIYIYIDLFNIFKHIQWNPWSPVLHIPSYPEPSEPSAPRAPWGEHLAGRACPGVSPGRGTDAETIGKPCPYAPCMVHKPTFGMMISRANVGKYSIYYIQIKNIWDGKPTMWKFTGR